MHITLNNPTFNLHAAPTSLASAFIAALLRSGDDEQEPREGTAVAIEPTYDRPAIGEYWKGQGGFFAGDFRGDDGSIFGLICAEEDLGTKEWGPSGEVTGLTNWNGQENTRILLANGNYPAAKAASEYTHDGHSDFYLPSQRELQLAAANIRHLFKSSYHWSSTPWGKDYAWALDFKNGYTDHHDRRYEFRAAPFRRFLDSSL